MPRPPPHTLQPTSHQSTERKTMSNELNALELAQIQTLRAKTLADIAATALEGNHKDQVLREAIALATGETKEEINKELIAESRGTTPTIPDDERPLDVRTFLASKGVPAGIVAAYESSFENRVEDLFIALTGTPPRTAPTVVNGATREANCYTEVDRLLFEDVWEDYADNHPLKLAADN